MWRGYVVKDILEFWYSERVKPLHFVKNKAFDDEITEKFLSVYEQGVAGELESWKESAEGALALVILFDQFPRNMFRDTPKAFDTDTHALNIALEVIQKGWDKTMLNEHKTYLYMPFMHSEDLDMQNQGIQLFREAGLELNLKFAIAHKDIVEKFGRFPHRNDILGRQSTPEEVEFLKQPGSSF